MVDHDDGSGVEDILLMVLMVGINDHLQWQPAKYTEFSSRVDVGQLVELRTATVHS